MTKEEALSKWCPFARTVFGAEGYTTQTFNRFLCNPDDEEASAIAARLNESKGAKCIADECACWVPDDSTYVSDFATKRVVEVEIGHCGLIR